MEDYDPKVRIIAAWSKAKVPHADSYLVQEITPRNFANIKDIIYQSFIANMF